MYGYSDPNRFDNFNNTNNYSSANQGAPLDPPVPSQPEPGSTPPRRRSKKPHPVRRFLSLVLTAAVLGSVAGGTFYGTGLLLAQPEDGQSISTGGLSLTSLSASDSKADLDVSDIAAQGLSSIVAITNISVQEVQNYFGMFGRNGRMPVQLEETTSCGSGVIFYANDDAWYILTNYHVVEDATTLSVSFVDDQTCEAELCGYDADNDIAVIRVAASDIPAETLSQISVAPMGDSEELVVGEQVVAIGNALGYGQSVTTGIVSALNRSVSGDTSGATYIQTDAAINPGNSGGALLNMDGEVIGINTAKISSTGIEGMGYAIPISRVLEIISQFTID